MSLLPTYASAPKELTGLAVSTSYRCTIRFSYISFGRLGITFSMHLARAAGDYPCQAVCAVPAASLPGRIISQLYNNATLSDVVIKCGSLAVKAHKTILAAQSATLRAAFSGHSSYGVKAGIYTIKEADMCPYILQDVLQWMYLRPIANAADKVDELLEAADFLQMAALKEACSRILIQQLDVHNCLLTLNTAFVYNLATVKWPANELFIYNRQAVLAQNPNWAEVLVDVPQTALEMLGLNVSQ